MTSLKALMVFSEPENFARCVSLCGSLVAAGDFSGAIHIWDVAGIVNDQQAGGNRSVSARSHRVFKVGFRCFDQF